jgi:hypothetical protein
MEWDELQIKHFNEWKEFEKEKSQAWTKMNDKHEEMRQVFKNDPARLPTESAALIKANGEKRAGSVCDWSIVSKEIPNASLNNKNAPDVYLKSPTR